jgi:glutamate dehydrogenase
MTTVLQDHLPAVLLETAGRRIHERMPIAYRRWLIAKSLAARIVYREGIEAVEDVEVESIGPLAAEFLHREAKREDLADEVESSTIKHAAQIADVLRTSSIFSTVKSGEIESP